MVRFQQLGIERQRLERCEQSSNSAKRQRQLRNRGEAAYAARGNHIIVLPMFSLVCQFFRATPECRDVLKLQRLSDVPQEFHLPPPGFEQRHREMRKGDRERQSRYAAAGAYVQQAHCRFAFRNSAQHRHSQDGRNGFEQQQPLNLRRIMYSGKI